MLQWIWILLFFLRSWKIFFCSCLKQVVLSVVAADHWSPEVCSKWWSRFNIEPFACQECLACNKPHVESETGFEISSRCLQNLKEAQDWRRSITICHKAHHARFTNSIVVIWTLLEQNSQEAVHILRNTHLFLPFISGEGEGGTVPYVIWKRNRSKSWRWPSEQTLVCAKYFIFLYLLWFPTVRGHLFIGHLSIGQISIGTFIHLYQISDRSCSSSGRLIW